MPLAVLDAQISLLGIAIQIERWDGGSGSTAISNGVLFGEGLVSAAAVAAREIRVYLNGVEQSVYIEALDGRWPDGSIKALLVQFSYSFTSPVTGHILLDQGPRGTSDLTKQTLVSEPDALIYPTSTTHLCNAYPFQPWDRIVPFASWPAGGAFDEYRARMEGDAPYAASGFEVFWNDASALGAGQGYLIYGAAAYWMGKSQFAWFCMSGEAKYLYRGIYTVSRWLVDYANPNLWVLPEPAAINIQDALFHYWLTGVDSSRLAPKTFLEHSNYTAANMASPSYSLNQGRIHSAHLQALVFGYHLGLANPTFDAAAGATWALKAATWVDARTTLQTASAALTAPPEAVAGETGCNNYNDVAGAYYGYEGEQPWQVSLSDLALAMYDEWVATDKASAIQTAIQAHYDYIDPSHWRSSAKAWPIIDKRANGGTVPTNQDAPDLNAFVMGLTIARLYRETSVAGLLTRGDSALEGLNASYWPLDNQGMKQMCEKALGIPNYIAARQGS